MACLGEVWRGRQGEARPGEVGRGQAWPSRHGEAGRVAVRKGEARCVKARPSRLGVVRSGEACPGKSRLGVAVKARHGGSGLCRVGLGGSRRGVAVAAWPLGLGAVGLGRACRGVAVKARRGRVGMGRRGWVRRGSRGWAQWGSVGYRKAWWGVAVEAGQYGAVQGRVRRGRRGVEWLGMACPGGVWRGCHGLARFVLVWSGMARPGRAVRARTDRTRQG